MNVFNNLSIKSRLITLVAVGVLAMIIIGLVGLRNLQNAEHSLSTVYLDRMIPLGQISDIVARMRDNRIEMLAALQHDPTSPYHTLHDHPVSAHLDRINENIAAIGKTWEAYMATYLTPEEKVLADEFTRTRTAFVKEGILPAVEALRQGQYPQAVPQVTKVMVSLFKSANEAALKLSILQEDIAKQEYEKAEAAVNMVTTLALALILGGAAVNILLAVVTIRGINRAVRELDHAAGELAAGNLTARADIQSKDELGRIASSFNAMSEKFMKVVQEIGAATGHLASAAEETSAITEQTNSGIRQQQSETEQVATAMNEMNATVHEVSQNAARAAEAARNADEEANNGKQVVTHTIEVIDSLANEVEKATNVIHQLEDESDSIGSVLDVIRGIAEQTNLLALNAAIEAARAGEQGRGFAVVADEVRTLASRTQQSTAEIQAMIQKLQAGAANAVKVMDVSRTQAQESVEQVAKAGASLDIIVRGITTINDMNHQIASAAEEQSAVADEINKNIVNISQVAEQTSQGAQQTSQASEELARLAQQLQGLVGQFRA